jgi:hypothetical protein
MRWPDRRRGGLIGVAIVGLVAAGCTSQGDSSTPPRTATSTATEASAPATNPAAPATATVPPSSPAHGEPSLPDGAPVTVQVTGGELPAALVDGYHTNGGDLIDPAEWTGRYGRSDVPDLSGPGVRLVEGLHRAELRDGHWINTDEAGWLAMSRDDRDSVMASLRAAADIAGEPSRSTSAQQAADCVIDTYPPDRTGVGWQVQGCTYAKFPGLLSLGVSRTGPSDDAPTALIDPTLTPVAAAIDGAVSFVEVRFGDPGKDGSTLRLSAHLTSQRDLTAASAAVTGGPLAGWQTFSGEASLLLSGPTGATWTLSDGVAVFTWSGRW